MAYELNDIKEFVKTLRNIGQLGAFDNGDDLATALKYYLDKGVGPGVGASSFSELAGNPNDNAALAAVLTAKADDVDLQTIVPEPINGAITLDDTSFGKFIELTNNGGSTDYTVVPPLPAAENINKVIYFKGLTTLTKVVTIARGGVTIAGEANWKLSTSGLVGLKSTGSHYIVVAEVGSWIPFTPVWGGFSADPTGVIAEYFRSGRRCCYKVSATSGTSSSGTSVLTVTAPFAAASGTVLIVRGQNNGTWGNALLTTDGTTTLNFFPAAAGGTWSTGVKGVQFTVDFKF